MRLPLLIRRPERPSQVSSEKVGAIAAVATLLGWIATRYLPGVEVPEDVLLAIAGLVLSVVAWIGRERRGA